MSRNRVLPKDGGTVRFRTTFKNTIHDLFKSKGWTETESDTDWDVAWVDKDWIRENFLQQTLQDHQKINHFPNHYELTRKDNLIKNLKRTQRGLQREGLLDEAAKYDFFPGTYVLPADYGLFVEEFKNHPTGTIWIMKPTGSAQGKGIFLFSKLQQINDWKKDHNWKEGNAQAANYVVQRYIHNPQLIGGKKFDLRLYVLVTSYNPLVVYMYRSGFARFSSFRYNTNHKNLGDTFVHLTNVAVQKTGPGFDAGAGSKWPLRNCERPPPPCRTRARASVAAECSAAVVRGRSERACTRAPRGAQIGSSSSDGTATRRRTACSSTSRSCASTRSSPCRR